MRVSVIRTSDPDAVMRMSLNGQRSERENEHFRTNYERFLTRAKDYGGGFTKIVKKFVGYITDNEVLDNAKRALTRVDSATNDRLLHHVDLESIHRPGLVMRRYIMANPKLYDKRKKNLCSGYEDEWEDIERDVRADYRKDYLQVIDGIVGDEETTFLAEENTLSPRERVIVHDAWDTVTDLIAIGIDPTDYEKGEI